MFWCKRYIYINHSFGGLIRCFKMNNLHNILNVLIASRSKLSNAELIMLLDEINRQLKNELKKIPLIRIYTS